MTPLAQSALLYLCMAIGLIVLMVFAYSIWLGHTTVRCIDCDQQVQHRVFAATGSGWTGAVTYEPKTGNANDARCPTCSQIAKERHECETRYNRIRGAQIGDHRNRYSQTEAIATQWIDALQIDNPTYLTLPASLVNCEITQRDIQSKEALELVTKALLDPGFDYKARHVEPRQDQRILNNIASNTYVITWTSLDVEHTNGGDDAYVHGVWGIELRRVSATRFSITGRKILFDKFENLYRWKPSATDCAILNSWKYEVFGWIQKSG